MTVQLMSVPGGVLKLCCEPIPPDPDALFFVKPPVEYHLEYSGRLPKDLAVELVRRVSCPGFTVNGVSPEKFLEGLNAD